MVVVIVMTVAVVVFVSATLGAIRGYINVIWRYAYPLTALTAQYAPVPRRASLMRPIDVQVGVVVVEVDNGQW